MYAQIVNILSCIFFIFAFTNAILSILAFIYRYSFFSFDVLPLVEFTLEEGISDDEANHLLQIPPKRNKKQIDSDGWKELHNGSILTF